jgi:hypothetical protein
MTTMIRLWGLVSAVAVGPIVESVHAADRGILSGYTGYAAFRARIDTDLHGRLEHLQR